MTTDTIPVPGPEGHVACPLCGGPLAFYAGADALDCAGCGVVLVLAPDPAIVVAPRPRRDLAAAA
jgi:NADH pyrophosphatase NudC (nudix superfamily)